MLRCVLEVANERIELRLVGEHGPGSHSRLITCLAFLLSCRQQLLQLRCIQVVLLQDKVFAGTVLDGDETSHVLRLLVKIVIAERGAMSPLLNFLACIR